MSGVKKVNMRSRAAAPKIALIGGTDYEVKEEGGQSWLPFPKTPELEKIRHTWILVRNERPKVQRFIKLPCQIERMQRRKEMQC